MHAFSIVIFARITIFSPLYKLALMESNGIDVANGDSVITSVLRMIYRISLSIELLVTGFSLQ